MQPKLISAKAHGLIDYALVGSLLILPTVLGFSKPVRKIYATEALGLFTYIGMTDHPAAIKPLIPFRIHGKIDPYNILHFAVQTFSRPFRRDRRAMKFNLIFTALAGALVYGTDWSEQGRRAV